MDRSGRGFNPRPAQDRPGPAQSGSVRLNQNRRVSAKQPPNPFRANPRVILPSRAFGALFQSFRVHILAAKLQKRPRKRGREFRMTLHRKTPPNRKSRNRTRLTPRQNNGVRRRSNNLILATAQQPQPRKPRPHPLRRTINLPLLQPQKPPAIRLSHLPPQRDRQRLMSETNPRQRNPRRMNLPQPPQHRVNPGQPVPHPMAAAAYHIPVALIWRARTLHLAAIVDRIGKPCAAALVQQRAKHSRITPEFRLQGVAHIIRQQNANLHAQNYTRFGAISPRAPFSVIISDCTRSRFSHQPSTQPPSRHDQFIPQFLRQGHGD